MGFLKKIDFVSRMVYNEDIIYNIPSTRTMPKLSVVKAHIEPELKAEGEADNPETLTSYKSVKDAFADVWDSE